MTGDPLKKPLVLGIDPGLNITGYGLIEFTDRRPLLREAGVIRNRPQDPLETKLAALSRGLNEVLASTEPTAFAIEKLYSHYERPTTAILMGHARGVICCAAALADIPIHHYAATQIKKLLTGNGRAPKSQVQMAICREFGLASVPEPPDVADALAVALCHFYLANQPLSRT